MHCGAKDIAREDLIDLSTPHGTATWTPLPHYNYFNAIETQANENGYNLKDLRLTVAEGKLRHPDGSVEKILDGRLFGLARLEPIDTLLKDRMDAAGYCPVFGLRNANDKVFDASCAIGIKVFVCDNLIFSGDITVHRRHTPNILKNYYERVREAFTQLDAKIGHQTARIEKYQNTKIWDTRFNDMLVNAVDKKIIAPNTLPKVLQQWREPEHEEFLPRTVYSAMNAFTAHFPDYTSRTATTKGVQLHALCDHYLN